MPEKFMHVVEGKTVSNYHKDCLFIHREPVTGNVLLCKLVALTELDGCSVLVKYFKSGDWTTKIYTVPCDELRWYKKPNFTGNDLVR